MRTPALTAPGTTVYLGDCIDVLAEMEDASIDAIVTDPPYGLGFMGKAWDDLPPGLPWAQECLRVLKPGGYLLAFGGSRTWHRLAVAVEDAGFEIRDSIAWLYGSGFPKSLDVSKAIDKAAGYWRGKAGEVESGNGSMGGPNYARTPKGDAVTAAAAAAAAAGWGTALKPAFEPIVVGRKPLVGTVAANVLAHGTGALNIDATRVATGENLNGGAYAKTGGRSESASLHAGSGMNMLGKTVGKAFTPPPGRWPANVVLDGSQADALDAQSGVLRSGTFDGPNYQPKTPEHNGWRYNGPRKAFHPASSGGASRFFPTFRYQAKAPTSERPRIGSGIEAGVHNNRCALCGRTDLSGTPCTCPEPQWIPRTGGTVLAHPTVKPLGLMRWLVRLVTPSGGLVLDTFAGSGATLEAAALEGFDSIGIEREPDYLQLIEVRLVRTVA